MSIPVKSALALLCALVPGRAVAQTATNITALRGLAAVTALPNTPEGRAALAANLAITGDIQAGALAQPLLMPFPAQQQFAVRDCFITDGNAAALADGLGSTLAGAYQAKARYTDAVTFTSVTRSLADLIGYTNNVTRSDSGVGKYFFANGTTNGKRPVTASATAILTAIGGVTDVFGRAYARPAGSQGSDKYGNARPFQTAPRLLAYRADDYFGKPSDSLDWLRGPNQTLLDSPAYPSGHTTYGYTESVLLAVLVPERYQQMVARAAEYGNDRIIVGAHYAMDVIGGRATALHALAHLLANDSNYVGQARKNPAVLDGASIPAGQGPAQGTAQGAADEEVAITDYPAAVAAARADLDAALKASCGGTIAACAAADTGRFKDPAANEALVKATQTYGLPVVHPNTAGAAEDVGTLAPEAGTLLTIAFPTISLAEADAILTRTEGPGGGFLDDGGAFGLYSRLDLYAAAGEAAALAASRRASPPR